MVESVLLCILIVFAVVGICEFIYMINMFFYSFDKRAENYSLIVLKRGYAVKQLNYIWQNLRWNGDKFAIGIIAIIDELDKEEISECVSFVDCKNILLCTAQSVSDYILSQRSLVNGSR